jgi:succinyl-diaminopimelate desuccinylase
MVEFAQTLIQLPTINPPGALYRECAGRVAEKLAEFAFETRVISADGHEHHTDANPRFNAIGTRWGAHRRPLLHFNGHLDVVPPHDLSKWTRDPFSGAVENGKLHGRGSTDMKAGLAAAIFAAEALRRTGIELNGSIQISGTADEETGGFAGVAYLAKMGLLTSETIDYVIIPEPFGAGRICIGHKGLYWFRITSKGHAAHGSMPYQGISAIENMAVLLEEFRATLVPDLAHRITAMPVVPPESRYGTFNINTILGGQALAELDRGPQSPVVADSCIIVGERRFLLEDGDRELGVAAVRSQLQAAIDRVVRKKPDSYFELEDFGNTVFPTQTSPSAILVRTLAKQIELVLGKPAELVASPGSYDHKHFTHIGNITECVAYGPGILELAHQPDEYCKVPDIVDSCKVMALAIAELVG